MAKIQETVFVIKLSKLVKDGVDSDSLVGVDFQSNLEDVIQQLVDAGVVVEVESAE